MGPKPFSKAWRQALIRNNSKARVVKYGKYPSNDDGIPFDPLKRQVRRLAG